MAAFPSQQLYLSQIENSRQLRKEQYQELQRQERIQKQMSSYMNTHTQMGCYYTGQAQMATGIAYRHQDLAQYQNALLNQCQQLSGVLSGQASNPQDGLSGAESGRISKSFDQETSPAKAASSATQEAVREATVPKLTLESSPLFGRSQFGMFYRWRFDNPINALRMWAFKHVYRHQRGFS